VGDGMAGAFFESMSKRHLRVNASFLPLCAPIAEFADPLDGIIGEYQ
jgi:hypothetical protein